MKIGIIGGGISGLLIALLLKDTNNEITIFEKNSKVGGLFDSFRVANGYFNVGFHYSGSLAKNQFLFKEFEKLNITNSLKLKSYDKFFDRVYIGEDKFDIPNGVENFREYLLIKFPNESKNIDKFFVDLYENEKNFNLNPFNNKFSNISFSDKISYIKDKKLKNLLNYFGIFIGLINGEAPFNLQSTIIYQMLEGSRYIEGEANNLIKVIKNLIKDKVKIELNCEVIKLQKEKGMINKVITNKLNYDIDVVVSTIHPKVLINLIDIDNKSLQRLKTRIYEIGESMSTFALFVNLKDKLKHNLYKFSNNMQEFISILPNKIENNQTLITVLIKSNFNKYSNLNKKEYKIQKAKDTKYFVNKIVENFPEFKGKIEVLDSATPLTFKKYSNDISGSVYGLTLSTKERSKNPILPFTKIKNLFLAGQSIIAPGLIGCYLSALMSINLINKFAGERVHEC